MQKNLEKGRKLNNRYEIIRTIGRGGFGITYAAKDTELDENVVIKEYFPQSSASRLSDGTVSHSEDTLFERGKMRFLDEARILANVFEVDGVVKILGFFEENSTAYMVMEFVRGVTLRAYLERGGEEIGFRDALEKLLPVMNSLEAVHEKGLIHRDINPDNIMVQEDGSLKLLDFGSARQFFFEEERQKTMSILVKNGYAPPEQYDSHGNHGPWVDVYSLCATLYEMITGCVPQDASSRIIKDSLYPPSSFGTDITPEDEELLMNRGLAVKTADRFKTVKEMKNSFYPKVSGGQEKKKTRRIVLTAAFFAAALMIALGVFVLKAEEPPAGNYSRGSAEYESFLNFVNENKLSEARQKKTDTQESGTVYTVDENAVRKLGVPANRTAMNQTREEVLEYLKKEGYDTKIRKESSACTVTVEKYGVIRTSFGHAERINPGNNGPSAFIYEYDVNSRKLYYILYYIDDIKDRKQYQLIADYSARFGAGDTGVKYDRKKTADYLMNGAQNFMKSHSAGDAQKIGYIFSFGIDARKISKNVMAFYVYPVNMYGEHSLNEW